jgi:membrane protease YdiL (CAAX protease family)
VRLPAVVEAALVERVPRDHRESDREFRRRRVVVAITLLAGAALLGLSLATEPGDPLFYPLLTAVAGVWTLGALLSGPLHLGYRPARESPRGGQGGGDAATGEDDADGRPLRRPFATPIALGLGSGAVFLGGAAVVRFVDPLQTLVVDVLDHAQQGNLVLVTGLALANGAAEELFFRGALYAAIGRRAPVVASTAVYALVTVATRNPMLVFAAVLMGLLFGLQRRASGGILASLLTHLVWSLMMVLALPPVVGA